MGPIHCLLALLFARLNIAAAAFAADTTCEKPVSLGGLGFCGPAACVNAKTTKPSCTFPSQSIDYAASVAKSPCRTCTPSTAAGKCSAAALKATMVGPGVKAAFCTDTHLVMYTDGTPTWTPNLDDTPNPPGSSFTNGTACVTRSASLTPAFSTWRIPLTWTLLPTGAATNNMNNFPDGAADSDKGYMASNAPGIGSYGLPTRGAVGVSVTGQEIFPLYNNRAELTPESCEVDSCNEHIGGGGGQPHLHGDPFGSWCLYSAANYSSVAAHPPQIGWSLDGPLIYGRYLATTAPGATSQPLDDCGGHDHDAYGYHYHAQVLNVTTSSKAHPAVGGGVSYAASTPGVYQCWRGDLSKTPGGTTAFFGGNREYDRPCCGMTAYYAAAGIAINGAGVLDTTAPAATTTGGSGSSPPPVGAGGGPALTAAGGNVTANGTTNGTGNGTGNTNGAGAMRVSATQALLLIALALASCALLA